MNITEVNEIKMKSNGDLKVLLTGLMEYGITSFVTCASTGKSMYFNADGECVYDEQNFYEFPIGILNKEKFVSDLRDHQQGKMDFMAWTELTAASGVTHWNLDLVNQVCTYYADEEKVFTESLKG